MSKIDNEIINSLKLLSLDMIKSFGHGDAGLSLCSASIFYSLFKNHLNYDINNPNWLNRDRIVVSNRYLPLMYATMHAFGLNISLDNLKEYGEYASTTSSHISNLENLNIGTVSSGDNIAIGTGIALGENYLNKLLKSVLPKNDSVDFHTYVICTEEDLMNGSAYEAMSFASIHHLNKLVFIVNVTSVAKDSSYKETFNEDLMDRFDSLNFNIIEVKNSLNNIDSAIDEAKTSKKIPLIIIKSIYAMDSLNENSNKNFNQPLDDKDMDNLRNKYKMNSDFYLDTNLVKKIQSDVGKRISKVMAKWQLSYEECLKKPLAKEIMNFLTTTKFEAKFDSNNLKINDNYKENLIVTNSKMLNIYANKSPFILSGSNDNFIYTLTSIKKSNVMSYENPTGKNILFGSRTYSMGLIASGLASLGFKVFISAPLIDTNILAHSIKLSTIYNLPISFIFTNTTFIDTYLQNGIYPISEVNNLRLMPNLITIRPSDVNEIIGTYEIISNYHKPLVILLDNFVVGKLTGTNAKYVMAGAYRVRKEKDNANAILIATGSEVANAIQIEEELLPYGIDLRVVSMPSMELFGLQNNRYQNGLLKKGLKVFVIEHSNSLLWERYATDKEYVFGINDYGTTGTKEELLSHNNLDKDYIKSKIIELMKKSE